MTEVIDNLSEPTAGSSGVSFECNDLFQTSIAATGTKTAVASGNADVGVVDSIALRPVNNAPVLDAAKSPAFNSENQNAAAPSGDVGTWVFDLISITGVTVVDNDGDASFGIAVIGADTGNGNWFYSLNSGSTWTALPAISASAALLLPADGSTRLYFEPNIGYHGTIDDAITFRAWDQTSGTGGSTA